MHDELNGGDNAQSKTPESPLTSNLRHASATIDELTSALANFSRVPSPEPQSAISCCCGKGDCENTRAWLTLKANLEGRLALSAGKASPPDSLRNTYFGCLEVGQALLRRHEAYVRRQETCRLCNHFSDDQADDWKIPNAQGEPLDNVSTSSEPTDSLVDQLLKERAVLRKVCLTALLFLFSRA
jgi:hypothetical protein